MKRNRGISLIIAVYYLLFLSITSILSHAKITTTKIPTSLDVKSSDSAEPIRIALAVDDQSIKDFMIVMNSVLTSATDPSAVIFHIVACGRDMESAITLKKMMSDALKSCFPRTIRYQLVAFTLPLNSGFDRQLKTGKRCTK
jgi:hypothetical protein